MWIITSHGHTLRQSWLDILTVPDLRYQVLEQHEVMMEDSAAIGRFC